MIDYELAKGLKEAGFPGITLPDREECLSEGEPSYHTPAPVYPTLSELIEACGGDFGGMSRSKNGAWIAYSIQASTLEDSVDGDTPDEAVARLWLALNNKAV